MRTSVFLIVVSLLSSANGWTSDAGSGQGAASAPAATPHVMMTPEQVQWKDGPASLPAGAKMAVLQGDPAKPGLFTMRLQMPAGYKIPAHWHPANEHVTVLSGTFSMGMGDRLDTAAAMTHGAGSFILMPTGVRHFAWSKDGATIQLHGQGPWGINYVNPADDPRNKNTPR
jgi:quercetin dioxygenase-like cupin family protein